MGTVLYCEFTNLNGGVDFNLTYKHREPILSYNRSVQVMWVKNNEPRYLNRNLTFLTLLDFLPTVLMGETY